MKLSAKIIVSSGKKTVIHAHGKNLDIIRYDAKENITWGLMLRGNCFLVLCTFFQIFSMNINIYYLLF